MSINRAILLGNVGRDPDIRTTNAGDKVATFSIATTESYKDKATGQKRDNTEWHTIVVWNQNIIPTIQQYVKKGGKVGIEGQIKTRKWQDRDGSDRYTTEIVIGRFDGRLTLEGSPQGQSRSETDYGTTTARKPRDEGRAAEPASVGNEIDDDIPF